MLPVLFAGPLCAQTAGAVEGIIADPSGQPVPAAEVRIRDVSTRAERKLAADSLGRYLALRLPPSVYEIEVRHPGLKTEVRQDVEIRAGRVVRVDFRMAMGPTSERIVVSSDPPLVNASAADWGGSISRRGLEELPLNGRDLFDLAVQQPGATMPATATRSITTGSGSALSVNGARPNQNGFRIDGIYINDAAGGAPASAAGRLLGLESISELRLVTSPFSAEYGRAAGAVMTAVSRSGGNQHHGSAYEFARNSSLDAKNFFDPHSQPIPPLRRNQFGGLLSGPLRRDKLFFLANYEGIRESAGRTERPSTLSDDARAGRLPGSGGVRTVPVARSVLPYLELYPRPNGRDFGDGTGEFITELTSQTREDYATGRLDWIAAPFLRIGARYTIDDGFNTAPEAFRIWDFIHDSRYQFLHTEAQWTASPNQLHTFRAGFSRVRNTETGRLVNAIPASLSFIPGQLLGVIQVTGLDDIGGLRARLRPRHNTVDDFQFQHDAAWIHGPHALRFGTGYDRIRFNQRADLNAIGLYRFDSVADLLTAQPRAGDLMKPGSDSVRGWRQHQFFAFLQEDWKVSRQFSLSLGMRYESYSPPSEVNGKIATLPRPDRDTRVTTGGPLFLNPSRKNFAPRAALAWDPFSSGKTVFRAGAGVFFDLISTRELMVAGVRVPPFFERLFPARPQFPNLLAAASTTAPVPAVDGLDYAPNQPRLFQFQASLERQFGSDLVVHLGYAGSRGLHLAGQLGNVNPSAPQRLPDGRWFFPANMPRLNPAFDQIGIRRMEFNSFYHSLLLGVERKWRRGFRMQGRYAWAKSIDETSVAVFSEFLNTDRVPTIFDFRLNRGLSSFDLRHSFALNYSYALPAWRGRGGRFLAGWEIHSLLTLQTGHPFNPRVGFDQARISHSSDDFGQRPDWAGSSGQRVILGDPARYFDPRAFALPAAGFHGTLGRHTLTGPDLAGLDLAVHKQLWGNDRQALRLRLEAFNLTNHPNLQIPSGTALFNNRGDVLGTAGRITQSTTPARQVQLALKYRF